MSNIYQRPGDLKSKVENVLLRKIEWQTLFSVNGERSVDDIADKIGKDVSLIQDILNKLIKQDLVVGEVGEIVAPPKKKKSSAKKKPAKKEKKEEKPVAEVAEPKPVAAKNSVDSIEELSIDQIAEPKVEEPAKKTVAKPAVVTPGEGNRIMIIDDSIVIQKMVEIALENESFDLVNVMKGEEAVKTVQETEPDLVFLDMILPDANGVDVMNSIRQLGGKFETVPIVMLSGKDSPQDKETAISNGATDFLAKPFHDEDLIEVVHKYFKN